MIKSDSQSKAVMISSETYEQLQVDRERLIEALDTVTDLKKGLADYRSKKTVSPDQFFAQFSKKYGAA